MTGSSASAAAAAPPEAQFEAPCAAAPRLAGEGPARRRARLRRLRWPFAWALLAVLSPAAVAAQDPSELPEADAGWRGRPVASLELEGLPAEVGGELREGLQLSGHRRFWFDREPDYFPDRLQADLARIRLYLARRGWPYSRLRARGELDGDELRLRIEVEPGPRVRAAEVVAEGWPGGLPAPDPAPPELRGEPYVEERFTGVARSWRRQLREGGFARAGVEQELARLAVDSVRVALRASPGPRFRMGDLRVSGVDDDLEHVVKRRVHTHEGEWSSPRWVAEAEDDLRELRLFRRIEVGTVVADSSTLDLDISLRAREMRTIELGAGYYSDEGPRGRAVWEHRNLFRRGRGLRLSLEGSRYLQAARALAWWPALWASDTQGQLDGSWRHEDEDSYELIEERLRGSLHHSLGRGQRLRGSVTLSHVNVDAKIDELRDRAEPVGIITYLGGGWELDRADDRLDPRDGGWVRGDLEYVPPGLGSVSRHVRLLAEGAHYLPVGEGGTVAFHLLGGLAWPRGDTDRVLASRRFFGGGALSVRSFPRRGLGPRDEQNRAIGGEAQLEASTEWRFGLLGPVGGAIFVDAGQVWTRPSQLGLGDLAWAAGPSLMVSTPVGPIRGDWGFRVGGHPPQDPDHVFHLTIGHPF